MAYTSAAKVAAFMGIPDFDGNSVPSDTEVLTDHIADADAMVDNIEVSMTSVEKGLLSKLLVASWIARAPGLFAADDGVILSKSYQDDYDRELKIIRAKHQQEISTDSAYGRLRKVNR